MKFKYFLLPLGLLIFWSFSFKNDDFDVLINKFKAFAGQQESEKIHLHLDKPHYAVGDDIWFKAYVLNTVKLSPSELSKIIYVDLIDERDTLIKQLKLPIMAGLSWGSINLNDSLQEGNYRIRAYTQYMRNFDPEYFYDKTLKIGKSWNNEVESHFKLLADKQIELSFKDAKAQPIAEQKVSYELFAGTKSLQRGSTRSNTQGQIIIPLNTKAQAEKSNIRLQTSLALNNDNPAQKSFLFKYENPDYDLQFLPEGGQAIADLPIRYGVKLTNTEGLGAQMEIDIVDEQGQRISNLNTGFAGLGSVVLTSPFNSRYKAVLKLPNGAEKTYDLPEVAKSGSTLSFNSLDSNKLSFKILTSKDLLKGQTYRIVAQNAGNILYTFKAEINKQLLHMSVDRNTLPTGIIQFSLFNELNQPIAERLVFNRNKNEEIEVQFDKEKLSFSKLGKSVMGFKALNQNQPVMGSFSVSVTNLTKVGLDDDNESHILSNLLLRSELKGFIEKPNHYFLNTDVKTREELDQLMLSQGWRKYNWVDIIAQKTIPITFQPESSMRIEGQIRRGKKPVPMGKVTLMAKLNQETVVIDTLSDQNGKFVFDELVFPDSTTFLVQARTKEDRKNVTIELNLPSSPVLNANPNAAEYIININQQLLTYIRSNDNYLKEMTRLGFLQPSIQLQEVKIKEKAKNKAAAHSSNLNGAGNADQVLNAEDLSNCINLLQCLQGRILGVQVQNGQFYSTRSNHPMAIIIDGINVEPEFVDMINASDIESIEILRNMSSAAIYGSNAAGGVMIITTKRGSSNINYNRYAPGVLTLKPKGLSFSKSFFSPKYEQGATNNTPDYRSTIYWDPQVVSNEQGLGNFSFYNANEAGRYRIVLEGIDVYGNLARSVYIYDIH